jgi:hypothetical protein
MRRYRAVSTSPPYGQREEPFEVSFHQERERDSLWSGPNDCLVCLYVPSRSEQVTLAPFIAEDRCLFPSKSRNNSARRWGCLSLDASPCDLRLVYFQASYLIASGRVVLWRELVLDVLTRALDFVYRFAGSDLSLSTFGLMTCFEHRL